jgi:hypothetical protein
VCADDAYCIHHESQLQGMLEINVQYCIHCVLIMFQFGFVCVCALIVAFSLPTYNPTSGKRGKDIFLLR